MTLSFIPKVAIVGVVLVICRSLDVDDPDFLST